MNYELLGICAGILLAATAGLFAILVNIVLPIVVIWALIVFIKRGMK
jgi:hypothetical protein